MLKLLLLSAVVACSSISVCHAMSYDDCTKSYSLETCDSADRVCDGFTRDRCNTGIYDQCLGLVASGQGTSSLDQTSYCRQ